MSRVTKPNSNNTQSLNTNVKNIGDSMHAGSPIHSRYRIGDIDGQTANIEGIYLNNTNRSIQAAFWLSQSDWDSPFSRMVNINDDWQLDISTATIDLDTFVGGLIDGISIENGRNYLFWALMDDDLNFAGIGVTRKPYSSFSAISGGSAVKGATAKDFTVTNAYQFSPGSRVVVRNNVGTSPQYEWNWAVVDSIQSGTVVRLDMDNNTNYGVNITGVTSGVIEQWDTFKPFVVTSSSQTLYSTYYSLMGETYTDSSGNIQKVLKTSDEMRPVAESTEFYTSLSTGSLVFELGRWIPLWADSIDMWCQIRATGTGNRMLVYYYDLISLICRANIANVLIPAHSKVMLEPYAKLNGSSNGSDFNVVSLNVVNYYIPGGMRF